MVNVLMTINRVRKEHERFMSKRFSDDPRSAKLDFGADTGEQLVISNSARPARARL